MRKIRDHRKRNQSQFFTSLYTNFIRSIDMSKVVIWQVISKEEIEFRMINGDIVREKIGENLLRLLGITQEQVDDLNFDKYIRN